MIVTVVQRGLLRYRKPFFGLLREVMARHGMELRLIYGQYSVSEMTKGDEVDLPWGIKVQNRYLGSGTRSPVYQPCLAYCLQSDIVVVEPAARLLLNYLLQTSCTVAGTKLVFWTHGRSFDDRAGTVVERFKAWNRHGVSWWFAYTELSADTLQASGISRDRITVLNNSVDTEGMRAQFESVTETEKQELRDRLGLGEGPVGIYCGSLYREKRIDFILDAAHRIHGRIPGFQMIIVGSGPEKESVVRTASGSDFLHYVGPVFGKDKAILFSVGDVNLNPGRIGLGVLDSFTFEVPVVTTANPHHSPEVVYLENRRNGLVTKDNLDVYVSDVVRLLEDQKKLGTLKTACREDRGKYTIRNMVDRFVEGLEHVAAEGRPVA